MSTSPKFATKNFRLLNGEEFPVSAVGTMLFCLESDGNLFLRIGDDGNELRFNEGDKYRMPEDAQPFTRFYLSNRSGGTVTVTVGIGDGDIQVANAVSIVSNIPGIDDPVTVTGGITRTSAQVSVNAAGNAELILAANANRTAWTVFNPSYAEPLYIGKTNAVTAATGYPILPRSHGGGIDQDAVYGLYATETNNVPVMEAAV